MNAIKIINLTTYESKWIKVVHNYGYWAYDDGSCDCNRHKTFNVSDLIFPFEGRQVANGWKSPLLHSIQQITVCQSIKYLIIDWKFSNLETNEICDFLYMNQDYDVSILDKYLQYEKRRINLNKLCSNVSISS